MDDLAGPRETGEPAPSIWEMISKLERRATCGLVHSGERARSAGHEESRM